MKVTDAQLTLTYTPTGMGFASEVPDATFAVYGLTDESLDDWDERGLRLLQLFHCWAWDNLLFWTLVPGHRPRHGMPLQPALAGLAALVWVAWLSGRLRWPLRRLSPGRALAGLLAAWLVVKLGHAHVVIPARDRAPGVRLGRRSLWRWLGFHRICWMADPVI